VVISDPDSGDERISLLESLGIPVVTIEHDLERPDVPHVSSDTERNTVLALDHLAERGGQRIALLQPQARWAWVEQTTAAFTSWAAAHPDRETKIVPVPMHRLEGSSHDICLELLGSDGRPDAILALADTYAIGALRAAQELGLTVPQELLICAGVDTMTNAVLSPSLSGLEISPEGTASEAIRMLVRIIAGEDPGPPVVIPGRLVVRESTGGSSA
jgi:DNA-binding LacI/PurR family transcriptional regulator